MLASPFAILAREKVAYGVLDALAVDVVARKVFANGGAGVLHQVGEFVNAQIAFAAVGVGALPKRLVVARSFVCFLERGRRVHLDSFNIAKTSSRMRRAIWRRRGAE